MVLETKQKIISAPSEEIKTLRVDKKVQSLDEPYNRSTVLSWSLPCRANGIIDKFLINCWRLDGSYETFNYEVAVTDNRDEYSLSVEDFMPDSRFNVSIRAVSQEILGKEFAINILVEAGGEEI